MAYSPVPRPLWLWGPAFLQLPEISSWVLPGPVSSPRCHMASGIWTLPSLSILLLFLRPSHDNYFYCAGA